MNRGKKVAFIIASIIIVGNLLYAIEYDSRPTIQYVVSILLFGFFYGAYKIYPGNE